MISIIIILIIILILVSILIFVKSKLLPCGPVTILINGERSIKVNTGGTLLSTLGKENIFLPSACGGGGTCIQCKCQVIVGGGNLLPTEEPHFSRKEISNHWRLGCQVKVKDNMEIQINKEILGIKKWEVTVISNYNVASFIKELVVALPENISYKAGGYIQIEVPKCKIYYKDIDIFAHPIDHPNNPDKFKEDWDKLNIWNLVMENNKKIIRAYSMASYPAEGRNIILNVRISTPPWDFKNNIWMDVNPGIASSYIFSRKPGDKIIISGPFGDFFINTHSTSEMIYVGGGAGMAPMRSHIYELFKTIKTNRKVSYWYGGRSKKELFYIHYFKELENKFSNFKFYIVLSNPIDSDNWKVKQSLDDIEGDGFVGFVHEALIKNYLIFHPEPEDIEFYFCGPPMMNKAVVKMCDDFGVPKENIRFDDFGN